MRMCMVRARIAWSSFGTVAPIEDAAPPKSATALFWRCERPTENPQPETEISIENANSRNPEIRAVLILSPTVILRDRDLFHGALVFRRSSIMPDGRNRRSRPRAFIAEAEEIYELRRLRPRSRALLASVQPEQ